MSLACSGSPKSDATMSMSLLCFLSAVPLLFTNIHVHAANVELDTITRYFWPAKNDCTGYQALVLAQNCFWNATTCPLELGKMAASKPRLAPLRTPEVLPNVKASSSEDWPEPGVPLGTAIDIESLKSLVGLEYVSDNTLDQRPSQSFKDRSRAITHRPSKTMQRLSLSPSKSQHIAFYSSSSNSTLRSPTFKEMFNSARNFQESLIRQSRGSVWWMDVQNPSESSLSLLCSAFHVHPLTIEDIRMQETREKIETFPLYYFACLRTFTMVSADSKTSYVPHTIYMVVFREGTLSFSFSNNKHSTHVSERMVALQPSISITRNWIFYAFVDDIVDSFATPIAQIESEVDVIDDQIYTTRIQDIRDFLITIESVRVRISDLMQLLHTKTHILNAFHNHHSKEKLSAEESPPSQDILMYISDIQDHVVTTIASLKQFESLLRRAQGNCLAQLDVNNDIARRRVIKLVGRVTVLTVILSILNLICGLFSTNVNGNTDLYATNSLKAFWVIISLEFVLALALFFLAKKFRLY